MSKLSCMSNLTFGLSLTYLAILLGLVVGWVMNVVSIVHTLSEPITGMFIARLVGTVVFPLGGILGYF